MIAYERETTVTQNDEDDFVVLWSAQRRVITAIRKKAADRPDAVTITGEGFYEDQPWIEARIAAAAYDPVRGIRGRGHAAPAEALERLEAINAARARQGDPEPEVG